ncbi:hypothetical protein pEaSNUABM37_00089 [Erwinia phage pEa_SNUABM_37]|nr:hypothetical protein pEaSNUABM37_00089 [Erwinia phage pEa_SNUABM_37]QXO10559.1 hypothetical protein pEaSNUABM48_00089 [Erwinia phage pEa_SNUABM_48]
MSIEVLNRAFALCINNEEEEMRLVIRVSENNMRELTRFIRFDALGFKNMKGDDIFFTNAHKVSSNDGVVESPQGKVFFTIEDGTVVFRPLNGSLGQFVFKATLDELATTLIRESNLRRWDDYCLGELGYNGHVVHFYSHLLFDDMVTITDRESFYIELTRKDGYWDLGSQFITNDMWMRLAEIHRTNTDFLPPHDVPLRAQVMKIMNFHDFNSVRDIKNFFNIL